jgi:Tfp pilus assembly protein PilX
MRIAPRLTRIRSRGRLEDGFTMIIALGVMMVTSLLLVAAFTAANGDITLAHRDVTEKQAYFAALAGVQAYEHQLQVNPNFWQTCESLKTALPQEANTSYEVTLLPATGQPTGTKCSTTNPFTTVIEPSGRQANTFRVESTGTAGQDERSVVATFQVNGFLDYVYFTRYEAIDPATNGDPAFCKNYRPARLREEAATHKECQLIQFTGEDSENGPVHTDDAADTCGTVEFGRKGHVPPDVAEINGGTYSENCGSEGNKPVFNTPTKTYTTGPELIAPEEDTSLGAYVEPGYKFEGATTLTLEGEKVTVTNANYNAGKAKQISLPPNGLIYVRSMAGCEYKYEQNHNTDTSTSLEEEIPCGTIYVKGTYSKSLTLGAEKDVVIKGNITPTGVTPPAAPTGTTTLGLIASNFVRIYHPCTSTSEEGLKNPWIYAAILSTSHVFLVDNNQCGKTLGELNVYGAIAQNFRGSVRSTTSSGTHGYIKNYNYDDRLATDEPPYFLAPLKAGWKVARETAPTGG